jgi:hypothetical protein
MSSGEGGDGFDTRPGAALYSMRALRGYDLVVHGISNAYAWRCPTRELIELYNRNVAARHMDIGVGTGYFLDRCRFPGNSPMIALVDLNPSTLEYTSARLRRYRPSTHAADVLKPLSIDVADAAPFGSIGLTYLLHCLPGDMRTKGVVFENIRPVLAEEGVVFGATILGRGVPHNAFARALMRIYNARGVFSNKDDSLEDLEAALAANFERSTIVVRGCVALFTARGARRSGGGNT